MAGVNFTKATQKSLQVSICEDPLPSLVDTAMSQITATQSIFVMTAGPVDLTITFLSPVEVNLTPPTDNILSYYILITACRLCEPVTPVLLPRGICSLERW